MDNAYLNQLISMVQKGEDEERCNSNKSVMVFDKGANSFTWKPENYAEYDAEKFSIVLWAGTVGIGLKENGETEEVTRTKEEAWKDLILRGKKEVNPMELVEVPKMPTVEQNGGSTSVTVLVVMLSLLSLIGTLARFLL